MYVYCCHIRNSDVDDAIKTHIQINTACVSTCQMSSACWRISRFVGSVALEGNIRSLCCWLNTVLLYRCDSESVLTWPSKLM